MSKLESQKATPRRDSIADKGQQQVPQRQRILSANAKGRGVRGTANMSMGAKQNHAKMDLMMHDISSAIASLDEQNNSIMFNT